MALSQGTLVISPKAQRYGKQHIQIKIKTKSQVCNNSNKVRSSKIGSRFHYCQDYKKECVEQCRKKSSTDLLPIQ